MIDWLPTLSSSLGLGIGLLWALGACFLIASVVFVVALRERNVHLWLDDYVRGSAERRAAKQDRPITDILVCVADHYEPRWATNDEELEAQRVRRWSEKLPNTLANRIDSDGVAPQHTFFYPYEEYREPLLQELSDLCAAGYGEIEIHLHHGNDTEANLRTQLNDFVQLLHWRHGALGTHKETGTPGYLFVHGDWALNNSGSDDEVCGVNDEIKILLETGCYADMTLPSAPSEAQVNIANRIYYATSNSKPTGHATGELVTRGGCITSPEHLMMITGPLGLNWHRRKLGLLPRIENGELADNAPCSPERVKLWLKLSSAVVGQPAWRFIKLHCHGVQEKDEEIMLGEGCRDMYAELERQFRDQPGYRLHYVTAREMYNIAVAAEAGETGNPHDYRDYVYRAPKWKTEAASTEDYFPEYRQASN